MLDLGNVVHIGLGANEDSPYERCVEAIQRLSVTNAITPVQCSPFYRTEPIGEKNQQWFINAALEIRTTCSPFELLDLLQGIEKEMGRVRLASKGPRLIDLDILLFNQVVIADEPRLIIPHPELHKRKFVLVPLNDIASYAIHPAFGVSVKGLLDRCADKNIVEWYAAPILLPSAGRQ